MFKNRRKIRRAISDRHQTIDFTGLVAKMLRHACRLSDLSNQTKIGLEKYLMAISNPLIACDIPNGVILSINILSSVYGINKTLLAKFLRQFEPAEISRRHIKFVIRVDYRNDI